MNIQTEIRDQAALKSACDRLGIKMEVGTFKLYETTESGTAVFLEDWRYPVVVKDDGSLAYDDYNGAWGDIKKLHELTAHYGLEKAKIEALKKGYSVYECHNQHSQQLELRIRGM
jgi:hypothetical protein